MTKHRTRNLLLAVACLLAVIVAGLAKPAAYRYRLLQVRQALQDREPEQALELLEALTQSGTESGEIYFLQARASRHLEAYEKAIANLQLAHRMGYSPAALEREKLLGMAESARLGLDDPRLQELVSNSGNDSREIYESLVKGYFRLHEFGPAILVLDTWESSFPNDAQPYVYRGLLSEYDDKMPEAERQFREALKLAPNRRDIRMHLARSARKQHHINEAVFHYRIALNNKVEVEALFGLGKCLQWQGLLLSARETFKRGLEISPDNFDCKLALGEMEVDAGRGSDALHWLEPALQQKPREYDVRYALAKALLFSGQRDEARPHFRYAATVREKLTRVQVLRQFVAGHPTDVERRFEIGMSLLQYGDELDGLEWLHGVFNYQPGHLGAHKALADYYSRQGNETEAAKHRKFLPQNSK